ncbi:unnamed protein product, partial [Meganyctiphanes norvegica]
MASVNSAYINIHIDNLIIATVYFHRKCQEHEKILFYHPNSKDIDTQVRHIGLAEAITRFCSTFNKTSDCESVHTQKTHQVLFQPEPNIWMVMTIGVGWVTRQRDTGPVREYQSEGVQDSVLKANLINLYRAFTLQHASYSHVLAEGDVDSLRSTIRDFFSSYISLVDLSCGDIINIWSGVSFLPLDRQTFLRIHCCLSLLQASHPCIKHTAFFYNSSVVWKLGNSNMQKLSKFLIGNIYLKFIKKKCEGALKNSTRFLGSGPTPSLRIFLKENHTLEPNPHHLLVYTLAGATICLTMLEDEKLTPILFEKIDRLLETKVSQLASDIGEQTNKKSSGSSSNDHSSSSGQFRYVYHNHMNLATKTTLPGTSTTIPPEVMKTIADMHEDIKKCCSSELVVKTSHDHWLIVFGAKRGQLFAITCFKRLNLIYCNEVNRMCNSHFSNIFMVEI